MESNERLSPQQKPLDGLNSAKMPKMSALFVPHGSQEADELEEEMAMDLDQEEQQPELGRRFLIDNDGRAVTKYRDYLEERLVAGQSETVSRLFKLN